MRHFRNSHDVLNVLATTALDEAGMDVVQAAVDLGRLRDIRLRLLHAVEHEDADSRELAGRRLFEQLARTDYQTLEAGVLRHVVSGPADEAIPAAVVEYEVDLLVIGAGALAERVLPRVQCSTLVLKPALPRRESDPAADAGE